MSFSFWEREELESALLDPPCEKFERSSSLVGGQKTTLGSRSGSEATLETKSFPFHTRRITDKVHHRDN